MEADTINPGVGLAGNGAARPFPDPDAGSPRAIAPSPPGCLPLLHELLGCLAVIALSVTFVVFVFGGELERFPAFRTPSTRVAAQPATGASRPGSAVLPARDVSPTPAPGARAIPPTIQRKPPERIRNVNAVLGLNAPDPAARPI